MRLLPCLVAVTAVPLPPSGAEPAQSPSAPAVAAAPVPLTPIPLTLPPLAAKPGVVAAKTPASPTVSASLPTPACLRYVEFASQIIGSPLD